MQKINYFFFTALILVSFIASAAEKKQLHIGIETTFAPFSNKTSDGKITGFDYDIGNALCSVMEARCIWVEHDFDSLIPSLMDGELDAVISSISITNERLKLLDFSNKYYQLPGKLVMRKGTNIRHLAKDLRGQKMGVLRSSIYDIYATTKFSSLGVSIIRYGSQRQMFHALAAGRISSVLDLSVNIEQIFLNTEAGKDFAFVGPNFSEEKYFGQGVGVAVRKGNKSLAKRFSQAIDIIRYDGQYGHIEDKYFMFDIYGS
ncbi:UNVERIFIED_CONTAM: hypothetical protein GTU68_058548 [Idotea baltica]|nr:hypothetical protein [Idotea baltica]